jgi:hypothetical protein
MLRVFALYAALVPVGLAAIPGTFARSLPLVLLGTTAVLVAESVGLLAFASYRLEGNGLAFVREERH